MSELNEEQLEDLTAIVKARLSVLDPETGVSIGSSGSIKRDELISHVEAKDKIGREFINMDWKFLQSLKTGEIYEDILKYS